MPPHPILHTCIQTRLALSLGTSFRGVCTRSRLVSTVRGGMCVCMRVCVVCVRVCWDWFTNMYLLCMLSTSAMLGLAPSSSTLLCALLVSDFHHSKNVGAFGASLVSLLDARGTRFVQTFSLFVLISWYCLPCGCLRNLAVLGQGLRHQRCVRQARGRISHPGRLPTPHCGRQEHGLVPHRAL